MAEEQPMERIPRELGGSYTSPYFVDKYGNEYESYALAWRYLGIYIDCGSSRRNLAWYNYNYRKSTTCTPKLLWAAYHDPGYSGGSIGEYQFYDWETDRWDQSTCRTSRCAKMDCHAADTEWELVGVYKESVEFDRDTFFEQLFKHEGYCLWDGDKESDNTDNSNYQFMQNMRNEMPDGCTMLEDIRTYSNGYYYVGVKPLPEGNMMLVLYTDSSCQTESSYSYEDYQKLVSGTSSSDGSFDRWNELMNSYKVCQPCRSYNRVKTYEESGRRLVEYNDGKGDEEQWGYNCYDDANYRNCNQCFKFETHTDMAVASASDLAAASEQGTIMLIQYLDGVWYGSGQIGPTTSPTFSPTATTPDEADVSSSNRYSSSLDTNYSYSAWTYYSFAGMAALVVIGAVAIGLRKSFRRPKIVIADVVTNEPQMPATLLPSSS